MQPELYRQMRDVEDRHWWFEGRRRIIASLLGGMQWPANAKILDLGCGTGGNLVMLSRFGAVTGVEMDEVAAELARERGTASVFGGYLPDHLPEGLGDFDCVAMLDVLEHIDQDADSLRTVHRMLAPRGRVLITVPAFRFLWGPHDEAHHHKRRYRRKGLKTLLQEAGFRVFKLSYYNTWLFPPAAAVRLLRKVVPGGGAGMEVELPPAWLNRMFEAIFASERHVLGRAAFPFGVSLLAIGEKSV